MLGLGGFFVWYKNKRKAEKCGINKGLRREAAEQEKERKQRKKRG